MKKKSYFDILPLLGLKLELVEAEQRGTMHYKNMKGMRLTLYCDGTFTVDLPKRKETEQT